MRAAPNTTVTLTEPGSIDPYTGNRVNDQTVETGLPAYVVEIPASRPRSGAQGRHVDDPSTWHSRTVRVWAGRLPVGTPVTRQTLVLDESTGFTFGVKSIRNHTTVQPNADVMLELILNAPEEIADGP